MGRVEISARIVWISLTGRRGDDVATLDRQSGQAADERHGLAQFDGGHSVLGQDPEVPARIIEEHDVDIRASGDADRDLDETREQVVPMFAGEDHAEVRQDADHRLLVLDRSRIEGRIFQKDARHLRILAEQFALANPA